MSAKIDPDHHLSHPMANQEAQAAAELRDSWKTTKELLAENREQRRRIVEMEEAAGDMKEVIDNLALLLRRVSRRLPPLDPQRVDVINYLKRHGLAGNALRGVDDPTMKLATAPASALSATITP